MYTFMYENQGSDRFLIYQLGESEELDITALQMMNHNKIPNLLPVSFTQIDNKRYLRYSGLGQSTLKNLLGSEMTKNRLLKIFDSICTTVLSSEEFFLDGNAFVLDKEYIYVDHSTGRTGLVYLPITNQDKTIDYVGFFKDIITNCITDPKENGNYIIRLLNFLNAADNFSLSEFMKLIKELKRTETGRQNVVEKAEPVKRPEVAEPKKNKPLPERKGPADRVPRPAPSETPVYPKPTVKPTPEKRGEEKKPVIKNKKPEFEVPGFEVPGMAGGIKSVPVNPIEKDAKGDQKISLMYLLRNFSKENLDIYKKQNQNAGESDKKKIKGKVNKKKKVEKKGTTASIKVEQVKTPELILVSLNPMHPCKATMKGNKLRIGRRAENNDVVLRNITSVSRDHCEIVRENGQYFVIDHNSTFGTKVDGIELKKESGNLKSNALTNGSIIELKEISFRVEIH